MNCPRCKGFIANDLQHVGPWIDVYDDRGAIADAVRTIHVYCECCGLFEARQVSDRRITAIRHITDPALRAALMRKLPGARFQEAAR